jgi:putative transferase (TIGR04331 family)
VTLLATTALEWTWGESEPLIFLGEWCRRYERAATWRAREHHVAAYHWDDRQKLQRDHVYLRKLHDQLLEDLASALGDLHGIKRSRRFWQLLLDPWLLRYLGVAFDRWESLRGAFEAHDFSGTVIRSPRSPRPPRDHLHFTSQTCDDDDWNHDFYADILQYEHSDRCSVREHTPAVVVGRDAPAWHDHRHVTQSLKWRIAGFVDRLLGSVSSSNDFAFIHAYFGPTALIRLNLSLRQIPRLLFTEFTWRVPSSLPCEAGELRRDIRLQCAASNRFESFLYERILRDVPQVLVESFELVRRRAKSIRQRPKVVLTANAHWFNDLFKHWIAEKAHENVRLIVIEHGGGLPPRFGPMEFEEDIADSVATWTAPYRPKHVRLPPSKLAGRRSRRRAVGERLVVVGSEMPRYAFSAQSMPIAGQTLVGYRDVCRLHDALDKAPQEAFLVKPYPDLGWRLHERFVSHVGVEKVSTELRLDRVFRLARIVVCTYPQTTLSEAMQYDVPTLLLYANHLWETQERFDGLIAALRDARIAFSDPEEAAAHINTIWSHPQMWWESARCSEAKERYRHEAVDLRPDWLPAWRHFCEDRRRPTATARLSAVRKANAGSEGRPGGG